MIGLAVKGRLNSVTAITNLVADRAFPELSPKQKVFPVVIYDVDEGENEGTYDGTDDTETKHSVTMICVAKTLPEVEELAAAVYAAFSGTAGSWGGVGVEYSSVERQRLDTIVIGDAKSDRFHMKELECLVWLKPT